METHYQKTIQKDYDSLSQKYQRQDFKDLYSMVNLFEGLIFEAMQKLKQKKMS